MRMKVKEFMDAVKKKFGDKVMVGKLILTDEAAAKFKITQEDCNNYEEQAWLVADNCPVCGKPLFGMLKGTFQWGIQHGIGECFACQKVQFRYYHFIGNQRVTHMAIVAF